MQMFHAVNSALNGHLLVAWAMGLNAFLFLARGSGLGLMGLLCGAVALTAAHVGSGLEHSGREGLATAAAAATVATALAWLLFILAASI